MANRHLLAAAIAASVALGSRPRPAAAELQIWNALLAQAKLDPERGPVGWLDLHGRRRSDSTLAIIRPGVGYAFSPALVAHVGYAWIPTIADEGDSKHEHRIWQQLIYSHAPSPTLKLQARARLEQRFAGAELGHRIRVFARAQLAPSSALPMQIVVWDEAFFGLNDAGTFAAGFDQNRAFVGVGADTVVRGVRVEAGYLNLIVQRGDRVDHAIAVNLVVNLAPSS